MPHVLARPCSVPGCPNLNCEVHKKWGAISNHRESASRRGYDRTWRKLRRLFLRMHPFCQCGAEAVDVHHIVALKDGGQNEWSNLEAMCHSCHSRVTASEQGKR